MTETTATTQPEADPRQGTLDLQLRPEDLTQVSVTRNTLTYICSWLIPGVQHAFGGSTTNVHSGEVFSDNTHQYESASFLISFRQNFPPLQSPGRPSAKEARDAAKRLHKALNRKASLENGYLVPVRRDLLGIPDTMLQGVSWTPVTDYHHKFSMNGLDKKIVVEVHFVHETCVSSSTLLKGLGGCGLIMEDMIKSFGVRISELGEFQRPVLSGGEEVGVLPMILSSYDLCAMFRVSDVKRTKADFLRSLALSPFISLESAGLTPDFASARENLTPIQAEFQRVVQDTRGRNLAPLASGILEPFNTSLEAYSGVHSKSTQAIISAANFKKVIESNLEEARSLARASQADFNAAVEAFQRAKGRDSLYRAVASSNAITLLEKLGVAMLPLGIQ